MTQDPYTTLADKMMYGELLTEPITFDRIKDVSELDDKRKKLKEEAQYILKTSQNLEKEKKEAEDAL